MGDGNGSRNEEKVGVGPELWAVLVGAISALSLTVSLWVFEIYIGKVVTLLFWVTYGLLAVVVLVAASLRSKEYWDNFAALRMGFGPAVVFAAVFLGNATAIWLSELSRTLGALTGVMAGVLVIESFFRANRWQTKKVVRQAGKDPQTIRTCSLIVLVILLFSAGLTYTSLRLQGMSFQVQDRAILPLLSSHCTINQNKVEILLSPQKYIYISRHYSLKIDGEKYSFKEADKEIMSKAVGRFPKAQVQKVLLRWPTEGMPQEAVIIAEHAFVPPLSSSCRP